MCMKREIKVEMEEYRSLLMAEVEASQKRLLNAIHKYNNNDIKIPLEKEDLVSFPLGIWIVINNHIRVKKRKNRFYSYLNFMVEMNNNTELGVHFSANLLESAEVLDGEVLDVDDDNKIYKKGDVAEWKKGEKHKLISKGKSKLHVLFKE